MRLLIYLQLSEEPKDISWLTALDNMSTFIVWIIWKKRYIDYWIYQYGLPRRRTESDNITFSWEGCLNILR